MKKQETTKSVSSHAKVIQKRELLVSSGFIDDTDDAFAGGIVLNLTRITRN